MNPAMIFEKRIQEVRPGTGTIATDRRFRAG
jgi:hypothetical protein